MLDHIFLSATDLNRSILFYEKALQPLGITHYVDFDGKNGPQGHPDLKRFGSDKRAFFWLKQGEVDPRAVHIGFVARSESEVNAFYEAAIAAGGRDSEKPGARLYYDPRYYAANILDPDGYSIEVVYQSYQHPQPGLV